MSLRLPAVALIALVVLVSHTSAQTPASVQSLPIALFERYLEVLRVQAGIPGLSAVVLQDRRVVWDRGFGYQDVESFTAATPDTPYPLLGLSQSLSSTVLLRLCLDRGRLELSDRVRRWNEEFPDEITTVTQLLSHTSSGAFRYDAGRYAGLTTVIDECGPDWYARMLAQEILTRFGMTSSAPSHSFASGSTVRQWFSSADRERYDAILRRVATSYAVDSRGRASRSDYSKPVLNAAIGVVSTVRDMARFDAALDDGVVLLDTETRRTAWETVAGTPSGLGWFVQRYNGERVVWQFGLERDAYSALYIKVPGRNLTLVLLANSDGLAAPYTLSNGDVTVSLFAQLFLKLFLV